MGVYSYIPELWDKFDLHQAEPEAEIYGKETSLVAMQESL
jgi:hypothetical protein